jgi:hypothetical protein
MVKPQGSLANASGNVLEQTVKAVFQDKGFKLVSYRESENHPEKYGTELLLTNVPYTTIYKHSGHTEFLARSQKYNFEIRIECKWQQSAGSVDEKLPYLYLNCIESMPEKHIVIIIDGEGFKKGSKVWLREAVKEKKYTSPVNRNKTIEVFSLMEFITWANKLLR